MVRGEIDQAIEEVRPLAEKDSDDQLVYLLDYALLLQLNEQYEESTKAFLAANDIADIKDYTSVSREAGSILLNEGLVQYKGDDFEKILINVYLALNFTLMGNYEGALVEARRINEKLLKFKDEAKRDYPQMAFARYLSAVLYEEEKNWDSSYIDYEKTYDISPGFPGLGKALLESSMRAQRWSKFEKWKKEFPDAEADKDWRLKKNGELVVIFQQGRGPIKRPDPSFRRVPKLYPRYSDIAMAKVNVFKSIPREQESPKFIEVKEDDGKNKETVAEAATEAAIETKVGVVDPFEGFEPLYVGETEVALDVENVAIKALETQKAGLVAKRVAGIVAKEVVSKQIYDKNEALGMLAWIGMHVADQADLRQWSTLPETIQVYRIKLPPGKYDVALQLAGLSGVPTGEYVDLGTIEVEKGKKVFLNHRAL